MSMGHGTASTRPPARGSFDKGAHRREQAKTDRLRAAQDPTVRLIFEATGERAALVAIEKEAAPTRSAPGAWIEPASPGPVTLVGREVAPSIQEGSS